jgi:hypothetical protein
LGEAVTEDEIAFEAALQKAYSAGFKDARYFPNHAEPEDGEVVLQDRLLVVSLAGRELMHQVVE